MKKRNLLTTLLTFTIAISIAIYLPIEPAKTFAASNSYSDTELQRAVNNGFGIYKSTNPQIIYPQLMSMLDNLVNSVDETKLTTWKKELPNARVSSKKMTRFNGMMAIMYAANFLGEKYTEFNADWGTLNNKMGDQWNKCIPDQEIWGDWTNKKVTQGFTNDTYTRDWSNLAIAYFYSFGRKSAISGKTIFDYNQAKNSMRTDEKFTYEEALLAVDRLYESIAPVVSERYATAEDKAILDSAEARKQAILNSSTDVKITGTSYYVSNDGNDNNSGLTPEASWKTIDKVDKAVLKDGDGVFFKRGDLWRGEFLKCQDGVTYSAYGVGQKPRISGSPENMAGADKWKLLDGSKNIWVYYKDLPFCNYMVFDDGKIFPQKKFAYWNGTQYVDDGTNDKFNIGELQNLEYFNDIDLKGWNNYVGEDLIVYNCTRTGKLYLRCDAGNPGEIYHSIEIAPEVGEVSLVWLGNGKLLDNLCIEYYGNCGVSGNGAIQNCEFAYLGGANFGFITKDKHASVAGGGINAGTRCDGMNITNNYIHESYDEGITIECGWDGTQNGEYMYNMTIKDNVFEKCRQACQIGAWLGDKGGIIFKNITFEKNYFLYSDDCSASVNRKTTRDNSAFVIYDQGERNIQNIVVKNNIFYLSKYSLVTLDLCASKEVTFSGNTYFQHNNEMLFASGWDGDVDEDYYFFEPNSPKECLNDLTAFAPQKSYAPHIANNTATIKVNGTYTIPVKNVNSITNVTYKITSGDDFVSLSTSGIITAKKKGTAKISVTFSNGINKDIEQMITVSVNK